MEALSDGLAASHAVERWLKTSLMNQPKESEGTKLCLGTDRLREAPAVLPADGSAYTEKEAAAEAERCELCACDACMKSCDLMRLYEKTPRGSTRKSISRSIRELFPVTAPGRPA